MDGTTTATVESSGAQVAITDDDLSGHSFGFIGYHYSGSAVLDDVVVESGVPSDPVGEVDGTTPQDTDGDGKREDFNANGETDFADLVRLFESI